MMDTHFMADEAILLEESTRRKFDQLMLVATRVRAGAIKGERRSIKRVLNLPITATTLPEMTCGGSTGMCMLA
jgi:hypothetical protein